jgi:hypothetical protein
MKYACLLLLVLSALADGARLPETRKRYLVKEVKGTVLAWPPLAPAWIELNQGDPIWEDTLIQVSHGSSITFEVSMAEGFSGIKAESMIITLNTPVLMRLRENIPRRLVLNDYFIPKIPDVKPEKDVMELMYETFGEAWERFAVNVLKQDIKPKFLKSLADEAEQAASVSMRAKKIKIYTPAANALSIVSTLPQELRITWKAVNAPNMSYGVRLWQPDKPRPEPMAYTTQDFYSVKVVKEGKYLVQIISQDGRWQSEVRQFSMVLPMSGRGEPPSLTHVNLPLPLNLPPRNFVFHTQELPVSVAFDWDRPNAATGPQVYTFVLSDGKGKELYRRDTSDMTFNLKFTTPGDYRWFIAAVPTVPNPESPPRIYSEVRTISIRAPLKYEAGKADPIEELLATNASRVFYLEKLW